MLGPGPVGSNWRTPFTFHLLVSHVEYAHRMERKPTSKLFWSQSPVLAYMQGSKAMLLQQDVAILGPPSLIPRVKLQE